MLGSRLTELRKKHKHTQESISKKLKIPRSTYSNYEAGKREPDFDTAERIAEFFDVTVDYLIGRTDDPKGVLSQDARAIIDVLDLAETDALDKIELVIDGEKLSDEELLRFIAYVRTERQLKGLK